MNIESTVDVGTTVTISLPFSAQESESQEKKPEDFPPGHGARNSVSP